jgi:GTP-binding protein HflX
MIALSRELKRVIGVLVDRRGRIESLMLGDAKRIYLPDIGRARGGGVRLRGVRLIRTFLTAGDLLAQDDLTDLSKLRLDAVICLRAAHDINHKDMVAWAHLLPPGSNEPCRVINAPHVNALDFDFVDFVAELETELEQTVEKTRSTDKERALIVYVRTRDVTNHEARLAELFELAASANVEVTEAFVQTRTRLDPKFAVGSGAIEEVELRALKLDADVLIFGQDLTPAQVRSITERTRLNVIDRSQLILDIFAQRALSNVGKLQVELAQLKYRLPFLSGRGTAMSRLGAGVGGRGPGETKLEIDRRRARDRIHMLEGEIKKLGTSRELRRRGRRGSGLPIVSIVGYTNAGKSTLLNTLTNSTVLSEDKLFATLDPTSRRLRFPREREIILTDTVGFIRDLPEDLRESFRSTLEELDDADLLLHLADASDPAHDDHIASTLQILNELDLGSTPRLLVFNKVDLLDADAFADLQMQHPDAIFVSAVRRDATRVLIETLDRWLVEHGHAASVPEREPWEVDGDADELSGVVTETDETDETEP